jgi:hypothetical protein
MTTDRLITTLAHDVQPVQTFRPPWLRAVAWGMIAVAYVAVVIAGSLPSDGLRLGLHDGRLVMEHAAALLTAITAAAAAFATVVPGYRRSIVALPIFALAVWVATVGAAVDGEGLAAMLCQTDWKCTAIILVGAALPAVALIRAIRRGAPLMPSVTGMLAGLAAAAAGSFAVSAFRPNEPGAVVLLWHCGTVVVFALCAGLAGGRFLRWPQTGARS